MFCQRNPGIGSALLLCDMVEKCPGPHHISPCPNDSALLPQSATASASTGRTRSVLGKSRFSGPATAASPYAVRNPPTPPHAPHRATSLLPLAVAIPSLLGSSGVPSSAFSMFPLAPRQKRSGPLE